MIRVCRVAGVVVLGFGMAGLAAPASAQTGPGLLRFSHEENPPKWTTASSASVRFQRKAGVKRNGEDVQLTISEGRARRRLGEGAKAPLLGHEQQLIFLNGDGSLLPERLWDISLAAGGELAEWGDWRLGATAGAGFAGDLPFSDRDGWYAKANLMGQRSIGEDATLRAGLNFNGNRAIFPDVPLPFVAYTKRASENLRYTLGVPMSAVRWQPSERWQLRARYAPAFTINGEMSYSVTEELELYGSFESGYHAFHEKRRDEHERLFFRQRRAEAGVRWRFGPGRLILAGGFSFDQEFERGFDVRDTDGVTELSDEPYGRVGLELRF
jgi:hypothetical protein